ncbi:MAG TPA: hypothetical protein VFI02_02790, partial [Armatimonadota bacterium]|nr:hypothetical protein [Armatimonadota bacterium]
RVCTAMGATVTAESAHDPKRFPNPETVVGKALLPTPTSCDHKSRGPGSKQGGIDQTIKMLPTPRAGNPGSRKPGTGGKILAEEVKRGTSPGSKLRLEPALVEWMMGYPSNWTDLNSRSRDIGSQD